MGGSLSSVPEVLERVYLPLAAKQNQQLIFLQAKEIRQRPRQQQ